jgi:hypothetical protein
MGIKIMQTINLVPEPIQLLIPKSKPFSFTFTFPYGITGYTYVAKIIDSTNAVIATLTCTPNTSLNTVVMAVSAANAALIQTGHKWYLQETRSTDVVYVVGYGTIQSTQVTDL